MKTSTAGFPVSMHTAHRLAPSVIPVFYNQRAATVKQAYHVALEAVNIAVPVGAKLHHGGLALRVVEEVEGIAALGRAGLGQAALGKVPWVRRTFKDPVASRTVRICRSPAFRTPSDGFPSPAPSAGKARCH